MPNNFQSIESGKAELKNNYGEAIKRRRKKLVDQMPQNQENIKKNK